MSKPRAINVRLEPEKVEKPEIHEVRSIFETDARDRSLAGVLTKAGDSHDEYKVEEKLAPGHILFRVVHIINISHAYLSRRRPKIFRGMPAGLEIGSYGGFSPTLRSCFFILRYDGFVICVFMMVVAITVQVKCFDFSVVLVMLLHNECEESNVLQLIWCIVRYGQVPEGWRRGTLILKILKILGIGSLDVGFSDYFAHTFFPRKTSNFFAVKSWVKTLNLRQFLSRIPQSNLDCRLRLTS